MKELLEECRRRYPPGTIFRGVDDHNIYMVNTTKFLESRSDFLDGLYYSSVKGDYALCLRDNRSIGAYLFYDGKWAEIIQQHYEIY